MQKKQDIYTKGEYLEKNPNWHEDDSPWKAQHILKMIKDNSLQPNSVCEVGCGAGEILNQLHSKLADDVSFAGYEISPQAFELSKLKAKERLNFYSY